MFTSGKEVSFVGHRNLDRHLNEIVNNQLPLNQLPVGSIITVTAEDAFTRSDSEFKLQLVAMSEELDNSYPRPIFLILAGDFSFHGSFGEPFGKISNNTLCVGGYSMQWLPQPRMVMVGFLSIGVGRDYNLDWVGAENLMVIAHNISRLEVKTTEEFQPPSVLAEFTARVLELRADNERRRSELESQERTCVLAELAGLQIPPEIRQEIECCCPEGIRNIGLFLMTANAAGRLEPAVSRLQSVFAGFQYQPPEIRGRLDISDNREVFYQLYEELELNGSRLDLGDNPLPAEETDQQLRRLLDAEIDPDRFQQRETAVLSKLKAGDIVIAETSSGNKYLLLVVDPKSRLVRVLQQKVRLGFSGEGVLGDMVCADLEVGLGISADGLSSSRVVRLYQTK